MDTDSPRSSFIGHPGEPAALGCTSPPSPPPDNRLVTCSTECLNQHGDAVLTGEATALLDELR